MSQETRRQPYGIRTLQDVRGRCVIDDVTRCWIWKGACTGAGNPTSWYPALGRLAGLGVILTHLMTGKEPEGGQVFRAMCGDRRCANPAHRAITSPGRQRGKPFSASEKALFTAALRRSLPLSEQDVQAIRTSDAPSDVIAEQHGITAGYVNDIRALRSRRPLAMSIFNLGASA